MNEHPKNQLETGNVNLETRIELSLKVLSKGLVLFSLFFAFPFNGVDANLLVILLQGS